MKKYLAAALCVSLCILPAHAEAVGGPEVAAASAVLMEKETGTTEDLKVRAHAGG